MGDSLKLAKDKRHRSSSSLARVVLEGTRSERKLELNASIPEMDDQFATAETRCKDLQDKIDVINSLKRKRKLKKRSMTRISDPPLTTENVPFISVRTQPKKKVSQQAARLRRLEVPQNPTRGYLDPATVEQHRMIGQVRGYNQAFKNPNQNRTGNMSKTVNQMAYSRVPRQRSQAEGDNMCRHRIQLANKMPLEVACGRDDVIAEYSNSDMYDRAPEYSMMTAKKNPMESRQTKQQVSRRRHVPRNTMPEDDEGTDHWVRVGEESSPLLRRQNAPIRSHHSSAVTAPDERPVVELFNKSRITPIDVRRKASETPLMFSTAQEKITKKINNPQKVNDIASTDTLEAVASAGPKKVIHNPRRVKYRSRRYEMPTVASQMKQAGMRCYYGTANRTNIPFVVSKSTAPSHNIGVNIQQVLNGLKIQQPVSGIPLTIAHHMGLGHVPSFGSQNTTAQKPSLDHREINVIKAGRKLLRLPSCKYVSYNRLLNLYREGDGMVPRFLRAISRPHYFYTSMYNLATNHEDFDAATSKGRGGSQEAKQSLAEYASLYREYEQIDKCIKEGNYDPDLERRREELTRELAAREEHIRRQVVQEYRPGAEKTLRASASTAEDGYRHSTFKMR